MYVTMTRTKVSVILIVRGDSVNRRVMFIQRPVFRMIFWFCLLLILLILEKMRIIYTDPNELRRDKVIINALNFIWIPLDFSIIIPWVTLLSRHMFPLKSTKPHKYEDVKIDPFQMTIFSFIYSILGSDFSLNVPLIIFDSLYIHMSSFAFVLAKKIAAFCQSQSKHLSFWSNLQLPSRAQVNCHHRA